MPVKVVHEAVNGFVMSVTLTEHFRQRPQRPPPPPPNPPPVMSWMEALEVTIHLGEEK